MVIECPDCKGRPRVVTYFEYHHRANVHECPYCRGIGYCEIKPATREMMEQSGLRKEAAIVFDDKNNS